MKAVKLIVWLLAALFLSGCAGTGMPITADLMEEQFVQKVPSGWYQASESMKNGVWERTYVPDGDNLKEWDEYIRVLIFYGESLKSPGQVSEASVIGWRKDCDDVVVIDQSDSLTNGFSSRLWTLACEKNTPDFLPEVAVFRGIQGQKNFYIQEIKWKVPPSVELMKGWKKYLMKAYVCHSETGCRNPSAL